MVTTVNTWRHRPDFRIGASLGATNKSNDAANRGIAYHNRVYKALIANPPAGFGLLVEPWLQEIGTGRFLQPDSMLIDKETRSAIIVEVKMNWMDGRADKLLEKYLPATKSAFQLLHVWPVIVTGNLRGYQHPPLLGLDSIVDAMAWDPSLPCPVLLHP